MTRDEFVMRLLLLGFVPDPDNEVDGDTLYRYVYGEYDDVFVCHKQDKSDTIHDGRMYSYDVALPVIMKEIVNER